MRLEVRIKEGKPYTLTQLEVTGCLMGSPLIISLGRVFSVQRIHKAVEKVRLHYLRRGHARVQVREHSAMNAAAHGVDLRLAFEPGPFASSSRSSGRALSGLIRRFSAG